MSNKKIVILAGKGITSNIVYNYLKDCYDIDAIIFENAVSKKLLIKKRIRKLGLGKVVGQLFFQVFIVKWLNIESRKRKQEILEEYQLNQSLPPDHKSIYVNSINSQDVINHLQTLNPDLVVVNGTRIISEKVLNCIPVKFINTHAGITPKYRNVHGAYWAIINDDPENCGVTVHLVDKGIDTGSIIYQQKINITKKDNFVTYPLLQIAEGVKYLKRAIDDAFNAQLTLKKGPEESHIWYHPTIFQYLYNRMRYNKK